jgi:hypothetical protein
LKRGRFDEAAKALGLTERKSFSKDNRMLRQDLRQHRRPINDIAGDRWLELQYGWLPAISEVENAVELLDYKWQREDADVIVRGSSTKSTTPKSYLTVTAKSLVTGEVKASHKYTVALKVLDPSLRNASAIGLTNLGSVAWELTPWSFVFDWFMPVGDFIEAQTAMAGFTFVNGCESTSFNVKGECTVTEVYYRGWQDCHLYGKREFHRSTRSTLTQMPSTAGILQFQRFGDLFNFRRAASSLALMQSVLR